MSAQSKADKLFDKAAANQHKPAKEAKLLDKYERAQDKADAKADKRR
jgi:hypothetical protein